MRGRAFFARKAGRRDGPHASIRDGLRALHHVVIDTAGVGGGVLDLLVYPCRYGAVSWWPTWLEVKTATGELRKSQLKFIAMLDAVGIPHAVARTLDEALKALQ